MFENFLSNMIQTDSIDMVEMFADMGLDSINIKDMESTIQTTKQALSGTSYPTLPDDFIGAYQEFASLSGLTNARSYAIENIPGTRDTWSSSHPTLMEHESIIKDLTGLSLVIDHAFFSSDLTLTSYQIMTDGDGTNTREDYMFISDHFPVLTTYTY